MKKFTICTCLYGEHTSLAQRCLSSILALPNHDEWDLRIGMNAVGDATFKYVSNLKDKYPNITTYRYTENRGKYAMMRWMFHDEVAPIRSRYVMWFDDDSYLTHPDPQWYAELQEVMYHADMCGHLAQVKLTDKQRLWITMQPWYNGKVPGEHVSRFALGGWWCTYTNLIKQLDWPPKNIVHLGGDYMLGEACRQHSLILTHFVHGVAINADKEGTNHKAERRGNKFTVACGNDYEPPSTVLLHDATKAVNPLLIQ